MASYYVWSGAGGAANGTSWANAYTTLTAAFSGHVAGDTYYVAHDHAESTAGAVTLSSVGSATAPTKVICVDRGGSVPPVSADRRATATITTTGANTITVNAFTHYDGIIFNCGTGANNLTLAVGTGTASGNYQKFENCSLRMVATGTTGVIAAGNSISANGCLVELVNTTLSFAAVGQTVNVFGKLAWRNTASALLGTIPTTLFTPVAARGGRVEVSGVDLSAAGSGKTIVGAAAGHDFAFAATDCKLNASVTKSTVPSGPGASEVDFIRCGSSGVNYNVFRHRYAGTLDDETTIVRTGGATDGTTALAWKIATNANCTFSAPFECPPIAIWNDDVSTGGITATVEGIWGGGAVPNDDEVWLEVEYLGDASSPQGSFVNDGKADLLTTAAGQSSSSETWGGSTTKFKLSVSFVAQQRGWVYSRVKCAKASSVFYIDPLVVLS